MAAPLTPYEMERRIIQLLQDEYWLSQIMPSIPLGQIRPKFLNRFGVQIWRDLLGLPRDTPVREVDRAAQEATDQQREQALDQIGEEQIVWITESHRSSSKQTGGRALPVAARPPPRKVPNRPKIVQEVDDVISRATSYIGWENNPTILKNLAEEIRALLLVAPDGTIWRLPRQDKELQEPIGLYIESPPDTLITVCQEMTHGRKKEMFQIDYPQVVESLRKVYPDLEQYRIAALTLLCRVQRTDGGSNWSPSLSYPGLEADYNSDTVGILESFCGLLNNQDLIFSMRKDRTLISRKKVTHARLCLDWKLIVSLTGDTAFVGSWPDDFIFQAHALRTRFPKLRLLVNPPYSNPEIERVVRVLSQLFQEFQSYPETKVIVSITLPDWPDLYRKGGAMTKLRHCRITSNLTHTEDTVSNFSSDSQAFRTHLRYRALVIEAKR